MNILLAEDDMTSQLALRRMLEIQGFSVDVAGDGYECLEKVITGKYDIILMDIHMPNFSGIQTARFIRNMTVSQKRKLPIIAMSASMSFVFEKDKFALLFDGQISKPFEIEALIRIMKATARTEMVFP